MCKPFPWVAIMLLALKFDGTVWTWGYNNTGQLGIGTIGGSQPNATQIPGLANVVQVAAGAFSLHGFAWRWKRSHMGIEQFWVNWGMEQPILAPFPCK